MSFYKTSDDGSYHSSLLIPSATLMHGPAFAWEHRPGFEEVLSALQAERISGKPPTALNPEKIRLVNWNIKKQSRRDWLRDLRHLSEDADLVLIQEAALDRRLLTLFESASSRAFAKGYANASKITGVLTLSTSNHLSHEQFMVTEPLLRTPKAVNVTTYALEGLESCLLVVNLHAVNFSLGLKAYQAQMEKIRELLVCHEGPTILAGDFNTWHGGRERILRELTSKLCLKAVEFPRDHRTRFMGRHLDHVFVRGLRTLKAETLRSQASDHNPMLVTLGL